jgi:hypothetical protein
MLEPTVDAAEFRRMIAKLKEIDPKLVTDLRRELRGRLMPFARQIAGIVPTAPPLSGFNNVGVTAWSAVVGKTAFTPGKSRRSATNLVSIRIEPRGGKRGFFIAELAGSRSSGKTASGINLVAVLNQRKPMTKRGGRYAYAQFRLLRPDVVKVATTVVEKSMSQIEQELK